MPNVKDRYVRNGTIELWRFVFVVVIVIYHGRNLGVGDLFFSAGAIGVEFFFPVSGFLMAKSVDKMPSPEGGQSLAKETLHYIGRKIKAVCPNYYVAWIIAFAFYSIARNKTAPLELIKTFFKCIYELLFLVFSGLTYQRVNSAAWYLHAMLLVMMVLYPLLRKYYDFFVHVIAPVTAVLILGYMLQSIGNLRSPTTWLNWTYKGNLRAAAELCLGISLYPWTKKLKEIRPTKFLRVLISIVEHGGYIGLLVCSTWQKGTKYDYFFLFLCAISIMLSFSEQGFAFQFYQNRVSMWLGEFSLSLFLSHIFYSQGLPALLPDLDSKSMIALYFALAFGTGLFVMYVSKALRAWAPKIGNRLRYLLVVHP